MISKKKALRLLMMGLFVIDEIKRSPCKDGPVRGDRRTDGRIKEGLGPGRREGGVAV